MIILPIGNDYQRRRFPRLTVTLIIACTVIYFITFYVNMVTGAVLVTPKAVTLQMIEQPLMIKYIEGLDPRETAKLTKGLFFSPTARDRFRLQFEEAMRNGKVVPLDSDEYREWAAARAALDEARRHNINYMLGYVPADRSLASLFSYQFVHGSFSHVFWNMIFLWLVGPNLEDVWGRRYFLAVFLMGGAVAAVTHHAFNWGSYSPMIGASGSIAAMMGAFAYRFSTTKLRFVFFKWNIWVWAWVPLSFWFGREVYHGVTQLGAGGMVATWAHVGGFMFGFVAAVFLRRARAEETFIAAALTDQDHKDRKRELKKQTKKSPAAGRSAELSKAIEYRQMGYLEEAEGLLVAALAQSPGDLEAREELVRLYFLMERGPDAGRAMGELIDALLGADELERALHWYGEICRLGLYEAAVGAWAFSLGELLERRSDWEGARANFVHFAAALPDDPRTPRALFRAGAILSDKLGRYGEAAAVLGRLAGLHPDWMALEVGQALDTAKRRAGRKD